MLHLDIHLADIDAHAGNTQDGDTTHQPDTQHEGCPSVNCRPYDKRDKHIESDEKADEEKDDADIHNHVDGLHREGGDAVERKAQHTAEGML